MEKSPTHPPKRRKSQVEFYNWSDKDFYKFLNSRSIQHKTLDKLINYKLYKKLFIQVSSHLKTKYYLSLYSPNFYKIYLESWLNPKWYKAKHINEDKKIKYLRWDMDTITVYNPNFTTKSFHSSMKGVSKLNSSNLQKNAALASKIYAKNKIFLITVHSQQKPYIQLRDIYYKYYKNLGFKLLDLGEFHLKPLILVGISPFFG